MTTPNDRCPKCGAIIPRDASSGQCLGCLLRLGESAADDFLESSASPSAAFPRRFGNYELLAELARGGMGVIYRARELATNRVVALKMIRGAHLANESEVKRFQTEAEAAANLDHPNIVPIYEVSLHDGQHYFTMKLVEGGSLAERMASGECRVTKGKSAAGVSPSPGAVDEVSAAEKTLSGRGEGGRSSNFRFDIRHSALLISKVSRAIHHAHQRGILHRDLKPSNILLDANGEPFVSDFGLAKLMQADSSVTLSDAVLGTAPYMSPEQAAGKARLVTTASDVWSLGVILYQLLTGQLPFKGENQLETLRFIRELEPAPPRRIVPSLPLDLVHITLKCLEKDPARRYTSAGALADDLECWLANRPIAAKATTLGNRILKWTRREPIKATAVVAILATALITCVLTSGIYLRRLPHMAKQHSIATANYEGVFLLHVRAFKEDRASENFWSYGFEGPEGQWLRLEFVGLPVDVAATLHCQIKADQPGRPDPPRTPVLTNGQTFRLRIEDDLDRNFYVASVGWRATNLLAITTNAYIKLSLLTNRIQYPRDDAAPLR